MDYISQILNKLLDKVENRKKESACSLKRSVYLRTDKDRIFDKYWVEDSYLYRPEILDAVDFLSSKGFVFTDYDQNTEVLKKITLNKDKLVEAYAFLNRTPSSIIVDAEITEANGLLSNLDESSISYQYLSKMIRLLEDGKSHLSYFKSLDELKLSVVLVKAIEENEEEALLRNFSKKKFNDSKLVEKNSDKLVRIFNEFGSIQYSSFTELCSAYYIVKDKGYVYLKNGICFKINNQTIDLDALKVDFALSDDAIDKMEIVSINQNKVVTIENLTTFHYFNDTSAIIIYLGGYHNSIRRKLLQKLYKFDSELKWYHMGDIDWGGFEIYLHLKDKTGIDFIPLKMGIDELIVHKDECTALTERDRKNLKLLLQNPNAEMFYPTIEFMLENGYKLEQESLLF